MMTNLKSIKCKMMKLKENKLKGRIKRRKKSLKTNYGVSLFI